MLLLGLSKSLEVPTATLSLQQFLPSASDARVLSKEAVLVPKVLVYLLSKQPQQRGQAGAQAPHTFKARKANVGI